jgi:glycosyltransferase involved in cell wall biosynthesis
MAVVRLVRIMRRVRPDIVHAHTPKAGLLGMMAAVAAGVPRRVYHMRGLPLETATGWRRTLLLQAERFTCRLAHRVICVSPSLRAVALREKLGTRRKLRVIGGGSGNGVDAAERFNPSMNRELRQAMRQSLELPEDAVVLSYVGRLAHDKGLDTLARAWSEVRSRHPDTFLLVLGSPDARDPVEGSLLRALQEDLRVRLLGHVDEVPRFYAASDLFVLPSRREGFPNVALEAAAMALPVLTTDATGCVDAVVPGRTGAVFPAGDAEALAAAIAVYVTDARRRHEHGLAGRDWVLANFQREVIWRGIFRTYAVLLRWRRPRTSQDAAVNQPERSLRAGARTAK